jgi:hypothetical protein
MLVLTGIIGVSALLFAMARWDGAGSSFHALFQIQLMGLYGAFLTADLFNLFVFFEVLLAASYGLLLHGSGRARVSSGLHYISINLLASSLFLIGAALIYGVTGTLNMADLALKIPLVPEADRGLLHARLFLSQCAGGGDVRDHDQGRRLHLAAPVDAAVFRTGRSLGVFRWRMADLRRHGDHGLRSAGGCRRATP